MLHHIIILSHHHIIISSYHHIISSYQHTITSSCHHTIIWQDEKSTCHFWGNSADRPGIWSNCNQNTPKSWDDRPNSPKSGMQNFRTSNGSKIARMAPISTIFCRNRPRRPDLDFEKNSVPCSPSSSSLSPSTLSLSSGSVAWRSR